MGCEKLTLCLLQTWKLDYNTFIVPAEAHNFEHNKTRSTDTDKQINKLVATNLKILH